MSKKCIVSIKKDQINIFDYEKLGSEDFANEFMEFLKKGVIMNRKKGLNRFMCLLLTIVFLLPTGTIVNAFSASIGINKYEMDEEQIIIQKYIITDNGEVQVQASIPIWGNWCRPGYGSGPPIDLLDYGCRDHDRCYGDRGYPKCSCDDDMLKYIIDNKDRMAGRSKQLMQ